MHPPRVKILDLCVSQTPCAGTVGGCGENKNFENFELERLGDVLREKDTQDGTELFIIIFVTYFL